MLFNSTNHWIHFIGTLRNRTHEANQFQDDHHSKSTITNTKMALVVFTDIELFGLVEAESHPQHTPK